MTTTHKPQTPLTDAAEQAWREQSGQEGFVTDDFARSLELKLQEAELLIKGLETTQTFLENENKEFERQRDEARNSYLAIQQEHISVVAERDQLIKVVDKAVIPYKLQSIRTHEIQALMDSYSLLPHVLAKNYENSTKV